MYEPSPEAAELSTRLCISYLSLSVFKTLRETSGFVTFQRETTLNVPLLFNSLYSGPKNIAYTIALHPWISCCSPHTQQQGFSIQTFVLKPLWKADWKLYHVFSLEFAGPILWPHAASGTLILQIPKYTHSSHTLGPVSSRKLFSPVSKTKGHWKDREPNSSFHSWQLCRVPDNWNNILNGWNWIFPYLYIHILSIKKVEILNYHALPTASFHLLIIQYPSRAQRMLLKLLPYHCMQSLLVAAVRAAWRQSPGMQRTWRQTRLSIL